MSTLQTEYTNDELLSIGIKRRERAPKKLYANDLHKIELLKFWSQMGGWRKPVTASQKERMAALREMAEVVIPFKIQKPVEDRREGFDEVKHDRFKMSLVTPCFGCGLRATERHHIIQLQNGGLNCRKNVVVLCHECHKDIHPWLK